MKKEKIKDGEFVERYQNGKQKEKGFNKDGEREGEWTLYYEDEKVKVMVFCIEGKTNGFVLNWKSSYVNRITQC